jgi:hypothetical protein
VPEEGQHLLLAEGAELLDDTVQGDAVLQSREASRDDGTQGARPGSGRRPGEGRKVTWQSCGVGGGSLGGRPVTGRLGMTGGEGRSHVFTAAVGASERVVRVGGPGPANHGATEHGGAVGSARRRGDGSFCMGMLDAFRGLGYL